MIDSVIGKSRSVDRRALSSACQRTLGTSLKPAFLKRSTAPSAPLCLLAVVSVASGVMALDRHFGEYVTLADAQVRTTQQIL